MNEELEAEIGALWPQEDAFIIDNDKKADWAVRKVKEAQEERDRLLELVAARKEELAEQERRIIEQYEKATEYLIAQLTQYMDMVKVKKTKTQETYQLLSGKLVYKYGGTDYKRDDAQVIAWCEANGHNELVKTKKELSWAELKKTITVQDYVAVSEDGEVIPGITIEYKPDKFEIKF
jgi:phage host-nuclease inhibitor protein Gam